ncbi:transcription factor grauzone-like [Eurosta solidaginis]|uniref:transcription factor grauzone-like n=1 Tax=Eurosta solidaginis TaxID=178769 RepID=UPI00353087DF
MTCLLCLDEGGAVPAQRFIDIFSEEGCRMNICSIISKHLWFKPERDISTGQRICLTCWEALRDFHIFYQRVAEVHNRADWKTPFSHIAQEQEHDPLPQEVQLKSEDANTTDASKILNSNDVESNLFDTEVKVEVYDLDLLPQIEVIEDTPPAPPSPPVSARSQRAKRRGRATKDTTNAKHTSEGAPTKRIKQESTPLPSTKTDDEDSETELPLSVLFKASAKSADTNEEQKCSVDGTTPTKDAIDINKEVAATTTESQKKRRGRPKKLKNEEATPTSPNTKNRDKKEHKNENSDENGAKSEIKVEDSDDDDAREFGFNTGAGAIAGFSGTDDSGESSSENSRDSDASLPDFEPKLKYAVIPKRKVVKPKKYRKREKPLIPPKRMTREEIEAKRAQQEEYDSVIRKFFGRFACPKCELLVKNFAEIRGHFRASHDEDPGYMMCCGRKFPQRKALAEHIYLHWNPEHFKCTKCDRIFQDSRNLEIHVEAHTNPPEPKERKMFQCDKCPKVFTTKAAFEHHSFSKHVPKSEFQFSCTQCNKKLPTQRKLKDHIKYNHDPESTIICDKCGKQVRTQYLKKHHQLEHSEQPRPVPQPMQCQICGTWLRHVSGLKQHMKSIHEDPGGEHRCTICNKVSTTARALRRHIYLNHECERKFKCTMCEKAFKRPQDLREHTSTHTGEVLYTCPNCPMTFFSNANMYKHRQRLHRAEWEADRKKPRHIANIMAQAMGATAASRAKQAVGAASAFFAQKAQTINTSASTIGTEIVDANAEQHQLEMTIQ